MASVATITSSRINTQQDSYTVNDNSQGQSSSTQHNTTQNNSTNMYINVSQASIRGTHRTNHCG